MIYYLFSTYFTAKCGLVFHNFYPPSPSPLTPHRPTTLPIIMEGLNLKISQNFVRTEFFLTFVGDKPLWGGGNIY